MDYELAKQLKEAGFPQDWSQWEDHDQELLQKTWDMYGKGYSPTLTDLLAECEFAPDIFAHEIRLIKVATGKKGYQYESYVCCQPFKTDLCSTPEEAVAKLWLSLNIKG